MRKYIYRIGAFLAGLPLLAVTASCEDWFEIMPQSEMVAEDFWKDEQDVESAVGACYRAMLEDGFMRRLIVWGELRSDNVVNGTSSDTEIGYILNYSCTHTFTRMFKKYTGITPKQYQLKCSEEKAQEPLPETKEDK